MADLQRIRTEFEKALLSIDRIKANTLIQALYTSEPKEDGINTIIVPVLDKLGSDWEKGELALSQIYMAGRICEEIVDVILPPKSPDRITNPAMAIAVLDDYHLLGKRIVYSTLRASGYEICDYGQQDVKGLIERTCNDQIQVLLISALMLSSALHAKEVIRAVKEADPAIQVITGGAPFRFDRQLYLEIGADYMGVAASDAIHIIEAISKDKKHE